MPATSFLARAALFGALALTACDTRLEPIPASSLDGGGSDSTAARDTTVSTGSTAGVITTSPATADLVVGATVQLSATGDQALFPVSWSSDAPGVAAVSALGVVTGVSPGTARITARSTVNTLRGATTTVRVRAR